MCEPCFVCLTVLHAGLIRTITGRVVLGRDAPHPSPSRSVHHLVLLCFPAQRWLLYFPVGALARARACVRAGSLRPRGTCYSFSLVFISPPPPLLSSVVYTPPLHSFLCSLPYLSISPPLSLKFLCYSLKCSVFV